MLMKNINVTQGIKVGGYDVKVNMSEDAHNLLLGEERYGSYSSRNNIIRIDYSESPQQVSQTFIHEMVEAVNSIYCDYKIDHEKICQLSYGIHQVMESLGVRFGGE